MQIDLTKMNINELKAFVYDHQKQIANSQYIIQETEREIALRLKEQEKIDSDKDIEESEKNNNEE